MLLKDIKVGMRFRDTIDKAEFIVERMEVLPTGDFIKAWLKLTREGEFYTFDHLSFGIKGVAGGRTLDLATVYGLEDIPESIPFDDALYAARESQHDE